MDHTRRDRLLEIFFRGVRGEDLSVRELADRYEVSTKSITRNINDLKAFLADHRDLVGNTRLEYSHQAKCYRLYMDQFLSSKELLALVEVMIGARAFSKEDLLCLTGKLKGFSTPEGRQLLSELIKKELHQYPQVRHDCDSVMDHLWLLSNCITEHREITIDYYRMDRKWVTHRLQPVSVMFTDFYFYLIAFFATGSRKRPYYFRIDRMRQIRVHRVKYEDTPDFDEGLLRRCSLLMLPGKMRTIRFEFSGPSLQAVLDKIPTAKVLERRDNKTLIEAEVYGNGIKLFLFSQGPWVKVLSPPELVEEIKSDLQTMLGYYQEGD